jgi:serine/threonine-protein kinase
VEEVEPSFLDSLKGERIAGRYVVERVIRSGDTGVVAAGRDAEHVVAIKFMREELAADPVLSARFLREAGLAARVKSPHFVRVFDSGKLPNGVPFLVMEMLEGRDLRDELDTLGPLPIALAVDYVLQAAVGVAEMHSLGIVHRDLKPSSLFLAEIAGTEIIKVLDFGVTMGVGGADGTTLTSTGSLVRAAHYTSPEQIRDSKRTDVRSDVWSLGVILYELLTDSVPFAGGGVSTSEVYGLILHATPANVRSRRADVPGALEAVIMKCLQREAKDRFADVGELAEALRPFAPTVSAAHVSAVHQALTNGRSLTPEEKVTASAAAPEKGMTERSAPAPAARRGRVVLAASIVTLLAAIAIGVLLRR